MHLQLNPNPFFPLPSPPSSLNEQIYKAVETANRIIGYNLFWPPFFLIQSLIYTLCVSIIIKRVNVYIIERVPKIDAG